MLASVQQTSANVIASDPIPARAGIGLKPEHYEAILTQRPDLGWFEIHPENYMGDGGAPHHYLARIREQYPISLHGVGLSIGSTERPDHEHLARLKSLISRYQPGLFSEHLAWSTHDGDFLNDLLPLPYTNETLAIVANHIEEVQEFLGRRMLLENPSTYVALHNDEMSEIEFLSAVVRRTGCGLLLDVNNVYVCGTNHGFDPASYVDAFPVECVGEIHLAGHAEAEDDCGSPLLIDAHDRQVKTEVWNLYRRAIKRTGPVPTLIEWDNDVPPLAVLIEEAAQAERVVASRRCNHG